MHINFIPTRDFVCYILTHKDNGGSEESWHTSCSAENVLKVMNEIPDWNTDLLEALSLTPEKGVLDWKLLWRNPQPQWASNGGRVIQLGDAAHSFLPTSGNGATQALEDGLSLATCLRLGGKKGLQLSTKAHVKLRYVPFSFRLQESIAYTTPDSNVSPPSNALGSPTEHTGMQWT